MKITWRIECQELVLATLQQNGAVLAKIAERNLILLLASCIEAELPSVEIQLEANKVLCLQAIGSVLDIRCNAHFFIA